MSLEEFVLDYSTSFPNDVFSVDEPIDINYEPTAYVKALTNTNPMIIFNKVNGYDDFRIVTNVFGKRERFAFALGVSLDELNLLLNEMDVHSKLGRVLNNDVPVKERIFIGSDANILSLPVIKHYDEDGPKTKSAGDGRYITAGLEAARNPDSTETLNLSFASIQVIDKNRFALAMVSRRHLWNYFETARQRQQPLPISVIIGAHPAYYIAGSGRVEDEYWKVTRVIPGNLTKGVQNDILVPADAEVVIEAEILPSQTFEEGPFSEFTGFVSGRSTNNIAIVKSILRKNSPIYLDITPSNSAEHILLSSTTKQARIMKTLKEYLPPSGSPYRVEWPTDGSTFMAIGSIGKPIKGLAKQFGMLLLGLDSNVKIVMINEGDGRLDLKEFLVNLAITGAKEHDNVEVYPNCFGTMLDPVISQDLTIGKTIMIARAHNIRLHESYDKKNNQLALVAGNVRVVLSHEETEEGNITVILDESIDLENLKEVIWGLATGLNPTSGVFQSDGRLVIKTEKILLTKPSLPETVMRKVK